jgi:hypothetical protein
MMRVFLSGMYLDRGGSWRFCKSAREIGPTLEITHDRKTRTATIKAAQAQARS